MVWPLQFVGLRNRWLLRIYREVKEKVYRCLIPAPKVFKYFDNYLVFAIRLQILQLKKKETKRKKVLKTRILCRIFLLIRNAIDVLIKIVANLYLRLCSWQKEDKICSSEWYVSVRYAHCQLPPILNISRSIN